MINEDDESGLVLNDQDIGISGLTKNGKETIFSEGYRIITREEE